MTKQLRVIAIVVFILLSCMVSTASAYSSELKTIQLVINGRSATYKSTAATVEEFLKEQNVELGEGDLIDKDMSYNLDTGESIKIKKATGVILSIDGIPVSVYTTKNTVGELLEEHADKYCPDYVLDNTSETATVKQDMVIELASVKKFTYTETKDIAFETETRKNSSLPKGEMNVVQKGVNGLAEVTVTKKYIGDKIVSTETGEEKIVKAPVKEIIEEGTKENTVAVASMGNISYKKALNVTATAYTRYDPGCDNYTSTGAYAKKGIVAIDPKVIPYGTKLYIPGYGYGVAADCGGAIKGNRIDLFMETLNEAYSWGRQNITIYILE